MVGGLATGQGRPFQDTPPHHLRGQDRSGGSMVRRSVVGVRTGESEVSQVSQVAVGVPKFVFGTSLCKKRAKPS